MISELSKKSILRILKEQAAKKILFITDNGNESTALYKSINDESAYSKLLLRTFANISAAELEAGWDTIVIFAASVYPQKVFDDALTDMLHFCRQSVMVVGPVYSDLDGNPADCISGDRHLYPTRFISFDFTYESDSGNDGWQVYNFYPKSEETDTLPIDNIPYDTAAEAKEKTGRKLNIVYALPHLNLTGGLKYMITHAKYLCSLGHNVYLMCIGEKSALPEWSTLTDNDITGLITESSYDNVRPILAEKGIDIIVAGFYNQISRLTQLGLPVLYWEQGSESLYGNFKNALACNNSDLQKLRKLYREPVAIAAVSPQVADILKAKYSRTAPLLYTGVDTEFYKPINEDCTKPEDDLPKILLVGSPYLTFKGFGLTLQVLTKLWLDGKRFKVTWASQNEFSINTVFPLDIVISAPQQRLAELYRTHDIFISGSVFESFPMPPMEAFASGTAVVAADSGGIHVYAKPGENILLCDQGKFRDMYASVDFLLDNPNARLQLARNARKTALKFSVQKSMVMLENILYSIVASKDIFADASKSVAVNKDTIDFYSFSVKKIPGYDSLKKMVETGEGTEAVISFYPHKTLVSRLDVLCDICKDKTVIHVGCADHIPLIKRKMLNGTWLHGLLTKSAKRVLGVDINKEAIDYVKQIGVNNVICADITKPGNKNIGDGSWDYMLFAEMIEHLPDPVGFLKSVAANYGANAEKFIVTVPNVLGLPFVQLAICNGEERINPDHKAWYTPYTLWKTLDLAGFNVETLFTCAYENTFDFLKQNEELVLSKPLLQDTIVAVFTIK